MPLANLDRLRRHRPKLVKLGEIAAAAHAVARELRAGFPVEGEAWVFEDSSDDPGVQVRVMNAMGGLDRALYPTRPAFTSPDRKSPGAYVLLMGKDCAGLGHFFRYVCAVMNCHDRVVKHYQVGGWLTGDAWPWTWPDLPPIPPVKLDALDRAAADLEGEVNKALAALDAPPDLAQVNGRPSAEPPPCAPPTVIWHHGGRSYSTDGETPKKLSAQQHNALTAFLDSKQALDTASLKTLNVANPSKVIAQLAGKFPGAVQPPGEKGEGYFIRVRSLPKKR
jgi:hypothetical protein